MHNSPARPRPYLRRVAPAPAGGASRGRAGPAYPCPRRSHAAWRLTPPPWRSAPSSGPGPGHDRSRPGIRRPLRQLGDASARGSAESHPRCRFSRKTPNAARPRCHVQEGRSLAASTPQLRRPRRKATLVCRAGAPVRPLKANLVSSVIGKCRRRKFVVDEKAPFTLPPLASIVLMGMGRSAAKRPDRLTEEILSVEEKAALIVERRRVAMPKCAEPPMPTVRGSARGRSRVAGSG